MLDYEPGLEDKKRRLDDMYKVHKNNLWTLKVQHSITERTKDNDRKAAIVKAMEDEQAAITVIREEYALLEPLPAGTDALCNT